MVEGVIRRSAPEALPKRRWMKDLELRIMSISEIRIPEVGSKDRYNRAMRRTMETGKIPPIEVYWDEHTNSWEIINGIHRANVVKELGYTSIPVVMNKKDAEIYDSKMD